MQYTHECQTFHVKSPHNGLSPYYHLTHFSTYLGMWDNSLQLKLLTWVSVGEPLLLILVYFPGSFVLQQPIFVLAHTYFVIVHRELHAAARINTNLCWQKIRYMPLPIDKINFNEKDIPCVV